MNLKNIELFAFDLFDTTVQETVHHNPYSKIFKASSDTNKRDLVKRCLIEDMSIRELLELFSVADRFGEGEIQHEIDEEYEGTRVMPGTVELFNTIRTKPNTQIAIISNLASPYGKLIEKLPHVDYAIFSYEAGFAKPQKEIFELLQQKANLPADKIVMIGNGFENDYKGAKAVGRNAIHLSKKKTGHPDESVTDLSQLIPYINS